MTPLHGGEIDDLETLVRSAQGRFPNLPATSLRALVHNHGAAYPRVLADLDQRPELARTLGGSAVIAAEVVHAVRAEMAVTMADVAFRRTDLATAGDPGEAALRDCAAVMARECGWSAERTRQEADLVRAALPGPRSARPAAAPVLAPV